MTTPTTPTPPPSREAIALGATLIAQASGDVSKARRSAEAATRWLRGIDPEFVAAPDEATALREAIDTLSRDLAIAQCDLEAARRAGGREAAAVARTGSILRAVADLLGVTPGDLADDPAKALASRLATQPEVAKVVEAPKVVTLRAVAPVAPVEDDPKAAYRAARRSDAPKAAPQQIEAVVEAVAPAPVVEVADEFAHLPPAMREWARRKAATVATPDID